MGDCIFLNLHSIMYLLILHLDSWYVQILYSFTFHNVSINSHFKQSYLVLLFHLHSIMYLLIRTFPIATSKYPYLHSIMYLLIRIQIMSRIFLFVFTFHNVSINSRPPTTIISSIGFLLFLSTSFYSPHLISIFLL